MVEIDGQLFRACATWHHPAPALSPREVKPSGASPLGLLRFGNTRLYPWEQHYDGK
jgi:hypothetical protein